MTVFLYLGGAAGVAGLLVSLAFATTRRRYGAVLLLGLALAAAWFAAVTAHRRNESQPPRLLGLLLHLGTVVGAAARRPVLGLNVIGWVLGATAGRLTRVLRAR